MPKNHARNAVIRQHMQDTGFSYVQAKRHLSESESGGSSRLTLIPLGIKRHGSPAWNVETDAHMIITGVTGSGKTHLKNHIIDQCLGSGNWDIVDVNLATEARYANPRYKHINALETSLGDVEQELGKALSEMHRRYDNSPMGCDPVNDWHRILVVIDPIDFFYNETDYRNGAAPRNYGKIFKLACGISRLGRSVGVHLAIITQHENPEVLRELNQNLLARVHMESLQLPNATQRTHVGIYYSYYSNNADNVFTAPNPSHSRY